MINPTLIIIPKLYLGGAETQFRMLFSNLCSNECYLLSLDKSFSSQKSQFVSQYKTKISECCLFFNNIWLKRLLAWLLLIVILPYYKCRYNIKNLLIIETYILVLLPYMKLLGYKVIYSERNNGHHKNAKVYDFMAKCDYLCSNSIEAKLFLEKMVGRKIEVINNGITILHKGVKYKGNNFPFKILVPARIDPKKNQMLVVEAAKSLNDCEIHFAGSITDKQYYNEITKAAKGLDNVLFDGFVSNMRDYYSNFDLVILPSREEGTSNVILECLADGIPCIVSDIEMNIRLQRNACYIFKVDDKCDLINAIKNFRKKNILVVEKDLRESQQWVADFYSEEVMVKSYERIFSN